MRIRKSVPLAILCLACGLLGFGEVPPGSSGKLHFDVRETNNGVLVEPVMVYIHPTLVWSSSESGKPQDLTLPLDEKGQGEVTLPHGVYHVFISSFAFVPKARSVQVEANRTIRVSEKLDLDRDYSSP